MANSGATYVNTGGEGAVPQWWGMYFGYIAVNQDPLAQGRVKLRIPQVFGNTTSGWASPMVPLAYVPKVGTPVTCMFVGGDPTQPVWFGNFAIPEGAAGMVFSATAPSSPELGEIWVNTTDGLMSEWNGAGWVAYQIGGGAIQSGVALSAPNITGGVITGAEFVGTNWIENQYGSFLYSGTPAPGNIIASDAPVAGNDYSWTGAAAGAGNAYLAGFTTYTGYQAAYHNYGANNMDGGVFAHYLATSYSGPWTEESGISIGQSGTLGFPTTYLALGSGAGTPIVINDPVFGGITLSSTTGTSGRVPITSAVQGGNTNNTTSMNAMFTPFTIDTNDAKQNTAYRVTCGGHGTQATGTAVALNFQLFAFGMAWGASTDTGGIVAGDSFHWEFTGTLIIGGVGTSEPASFIGKMILSQATASSQGHPTAMDQQRIAGSGVDTTTATNITLQAGWASTTGSPTLVCTGAVFERLGS